MRTPIKQLVKLLRYDIAQLQGIETDYRKEIYRLRDEVEKARQGRDDAMDELERIKSQLKWIVMEDGE